MLPEGRSGAEANPLQALTCASRSCTPCPWVRFFVIDDKGTVSLRSRLTTARSLRGKTDEMEEHQLAR